MTSITVTENRTVVNVSVQGDQVTVQQPSSPPSVSVSGVGVKGDSAVGGLRYTHTQASPLDVWVVNHNFGYRPDITVFSAGGLKVDAEILHTSLNQATVTFDIPYVGTALCE